MAEVDWVRFAAVVVVVVVRVAFVWLDELPTRSGGAPTLSSRL